MAALRFPFLIARKLTGQYPRRRARGDGRRDLAGEDYLEMKTILI
jgi:hypothetical protein